VGGSRVLILIMTGLGDTESIACRSDGESFLDRRPRNGIAVFPVDGESVDALLKNADSAMYKAKKKGRNNFQFYCNNLNAAVNERLNLEGGQHHAVGREDFKVFYQPQIDLRAGEIIGAEALVVAAFPAKALASRGISSGCHGYGSGQSDR
jgi:hypothetical protein